MPDAAIAPESSTEMMVGLASVVAPSLMASLQGNRFVLAGIRNSCFNIINDPGRTCAIVYPASEPEQGT